MKRPARPARRARRARPVTVPADLRKAFAHAKHEKASFEKLAGLYQRAYVAWIEEAKRPETRAKRIAQTLHRLGSRR